jgi:hypothetical protein
MCPYYLKHAYCKHLMHAHAHTHTRSDKIMLERKFTFQGNTMTCDYSFRTNVMLCFLSVKFLVNLCFVT